MAAYWTPREGSLILGWTNYKWPWDWIKLLCQFVRTIVYRNSRSNWVSQKLPPCYFSLLLPSLSFSPQNIIKLRKPVGLSLKHDKLQKNHNSCVCNHNCYKSKSRKVWRFIFLPLHLTVFFFIPFPKVFLDMWTVRHKGPIFYWAFIGFYSYLFE